MIFPPYLPPFVYAHYSDALSAPGTPATEIAGIITWQRADMSPNSPVTTFTEGGPNGFTVTGTGAAPPTKTTVGGDPFEWFSFSGTSGLEVADAAAFDPNDNKRSLAFWIRRPGVAANHRFVHKIGAARLIAAGATGAQAFQLQMPDGTVAATWTTTNMDTATHICIRYDGTLALGSRLTLEKDGTLIPVVDSAPSTISDSANPFSWGRSSDGGGSGYVGLSDDLVYTGTVMTAAEAAFHRTYRPHVG